MSYQILVKISLAVLCMLGPIAVPAISYADTNPTVEQLNEASLFFSQLAENSSNPLIATLATENINRLKNKLSPSKKERVVSLIPQNDNSFAVPALINQKSIGTFLIDTGASYTVITPRLAKKLNITVTNDLPKVKILTVNGVVQAPLVTIDTLTIGGMEVKNVKALIQPLGDDVLLAGLLGMNVFQGMDIAIKQDKLILTAN
jgi:clan AA aspartic protease (TIGR02281 family)